LTPNRPEKPAGQAYKATEIFLLFHPKNLLLKFVYVTFIVKTGLIPSIPRRASESNRRGTDRPGQFVV